MVVVSIVRWAYWHQTLAYRSFGGPTLQGRVGDMIYSPTHLFRSIAVSAPVDSFRKNGIPLAHEFMIIKPQEKKEESIGK